MIIITVLLSVGDWQRIFVVCWPFVSTRSSPGNEAHSVLSISAGSDDVHD